MNPPEFAQHPLLSLRPGDSGYETLLGVATAQARAALGKDVELEPQTVDRSGHWAFVRARVRDPGGGALSLEGTAMAEAAAAGAVSDLVAVLFRQEGGGRRRLDGGRSRGPAHRRGVAGLAAQARRAEPAARYRLGHYDGDPPGRSVARQRGGVTIV